jgi:nucleoside-diphosphate-sugar epimerase
MRYLITGGAGFLGSALVKRLVRDGHEVAVLDDFSRGSPRRLSGVSCGIIQGDIRDPQTVRAAMWGSDAVVHMAYVQGTETFYSEPRHVLDVAVRGMLNVLAACEETGTGELILVSSSEVYQEAPVPTPETTPLCVPDPLNPRYSYGGGKIISEVMASAWQRTGVLRRLVIARPHNVYGMDAGYKHVIPEFAVRMKKLMAEHDGVVPFPVQGSGAETRSFCHVDDFTDQMVLLSSHGIPGGIYHVGNDEEVSIGQLVRLIGEHYDRDVKVVPGVLPAGSPRRRCPDIGKIRGLGYEPGVPLAEGLGLVLDWYYAHPGDRG